jgi:hypothetical protein
MVLESFAKCMSTVQFVTKIGQQQLTVFMRTYVRSYVHILCK